MSPNTNTTYPVHAEVVAANPSKPKIDPALRVMLMSFRQAFLMAAKAIEVYLGLC